MASLLSAAVFITAVQAVAFDGKLPEPTNAVIPSPVFQAPEVTLPPSIQELVKRQEGQTVLVGPDNTCGYVDGRPGAVYSCNGKSVTCALVTTSGYGAVACCDGDDCGIRVACVDSRDFILSSACDVGCIQDTYTVKCTNAAAPYCGTVTFFDGIVDYYCDTLSYSTPQQLYTTYDGEDDGRTFTPVVLTISDDDSSTTTTHANPSTTRTAGASTTDSGDDDDDSTSTAAGALSSATSGAGNNTSGAKSSSTNVGAIAGGVVGGVVGLALIGLAIFFIVRHNKKKKAAAAAAAAGTQPPVSQNPQGPMPPVVAGGAGGGYQQPPQDPHYSQQYPQQPQYGSPQQQQGGYYADPSKPGGFTSVAPTLVPDRNGSTSPVSQFTDGRQSYQPTSPTSTVNSNWQGQQNQAAAGGYPPPQQQQQPNVPPTVHEAGGNVVGERDYNSNHHGQLHELG
ncbi:carnitine O-acetyltransferase yat1 [Hypoxylon texense]